MAVMFPKKEYLSEETPYAERVIYDALETQLPSSFIVFHSFCWNKKRYGKYPIWYENDFIILNKDYGALVLEVKGGKIRFENNLCIQTNIDTGHESILSEGNDPLSQAKRGKFYLEDLIDNIYENLHERFIIQPCIAFPLSIVNSNTELPPNYSNIKDIILDANSIKDLGKEIIKIFDFYNMKHHTSITNEEFQKIKQTIAPTYDLVVSNSAKNAEMEDQFIRFTNQQSSLLDYIAEQKIATIQGSAGTGKTVVAIEAAHRFSNDNKKVLFMCFNRYLKDHIEEMCNDDNIEVQTINSFIAKYYPYELENMEERAKIFSGLDDSNFNYDAIVIDEAQDFNEKEIDHLNFIAKYKDLNLLVFYDRNQILYTDTLPKWITDAECKLVLSKNCRNTKEIAITSRKIIDLDVSNNKNFSFISGERTESYFFNDNIIENVYKVIKNIKSNNAYKNDDITILSLKSETKSILAGIDRIRDIPITHSKQPNSILFTTAKKFKGLESNVIIVVDIDADNFTNKQEQNLFYVATSRAKNKLCLVFTLKENELLELKDKLKDIPGPNAKTKILIKTDSISKNN